MPASRQAIALTDNYRARVGILRGRAELIASTGWRELNPADLDDSHQRWALLTALRLTEIQRAGATLSGAYLAAYIGIALRQRPAPSGASATTEAIGHSRDGKPLGEALSTSLITIKTAIKQGRTVDEALHLGLERATRNSNEDVAYAARSTLDAGIRDSDRIVGWRRVTGGGCGACLAAATGAIQADDEVLEVHDHCQCSKEPVVADVRETIHRPTGEEMFHALSHNAQDALFADKGGAEKADLVRTGDVPFHALIERQPMAVLPDGITEAPLAALRAHL